MCGHLYIHYTSVLQQLCHLVLGSSTNSMERAQLSQSLHNISVLTVQSSKSDSCHCKVLKKQRIVVEVKTKEKEKQGLSVRVQCGVVWALSAAPYLACSPHYMCPLRVGQTEIGEHH